MSQNKLIVKYNELVLNRKISLYFTNQRIFLLYTTLICEFLLISLNWAFSIWWIMHYVAYTNLGMNQVKEKLPLRISYGQATVFDQRTFCNGRKSWRSFSRYIRKFGLNLISTFGQRTFCNGLWFSSCNMKIGFQNLVNHDSFLCSVN